MLEGESSMEVPVTSGVPQGSVLGPLLFLLYIIDLPQNIQSQVRLYADDATVYLTVDSSDDRVTLQADLDTLQGWNEPGTRSLTQANARCSTLQGQNNH